MSTLRWFGRDWGAPSCKESPHVDTPVGESCLHCQEKISENDNGYVVPVFGSGVRLIDFRAEHYECFMRTVVGSVGHQMHECECYGHQDLSELGMTKRAAAIAAEACHAEFLSVLQAVYRGRAQEQLYEAPTYVLLEESKAIACLKCGMISHNPQDIAHKYCNHCHIFHTDPAYGEPQA